MSRAGPVSRAGVSLPGSRHVCQTQQKSTSRLHDNRASPVSRDPGIAVPGSRLAGLTFFHVIAFAGPARLIKPIRAQNQARSGFPRFIASAINRAGSPHIIPAESDLGTPKQPGYGSEIKLVIFADDMTSFVRDKLSHRTLFDTIDLFSTYSGLKVNHDKTEILLLGNMEVNSSELGVNEISKVIKILGVHFTFNHSLFYKLNFESIEKSLRGLLKSWSWRGLTLLGKIQVIKSFAVPKILYRVVLISN